METLIRTSVFTLPLLAVIAIIIWWRLPIEQWIPKALLLLLICLAVYGSSSDLFFGDVILVVAYWSILAVSLINALLLKQRIGLNNSVILLLIVTAILIFASYVRYVPKADAFAHCTIHQYADEIAQFKAINHSYPVDIYARGQENPNTLRRNIKSDISDRCRIEEGIFYTLYRPIPSVIRYDQQGDSYLLRGFYRYDPLLTGFELYRTCSYVVSTDTVSCHFQLTRPFELPLDTW